MLSIAARSRDDDQGLRSVLGKRPTSRAAMFGLDHVDLEPDGVLGVRPSFPLRPHARSATLTVTARRPGGFASRTRRLAVFAPATSCWRRVTSGAPAQRRARAPAGDARQHPQARRLRLPDQLRERLQRAWAELGRHKARIRPSTATSTPSPARHPTSPTSARPRGARARAGTASISGAGTWSHSTRPATRTAAAAPARRRRSGSRPTSRRARGRARSRASTIHASAPASRRRRARSRSGRSCTRTAWTWSCGDDHAYERFRA
jgi:hypothetical protein